MKFKNHYLVLGLMPLLASCASQPLSLAPVGPQPVAWEHLLPATGQGQLVVYTATEEYDATGDVPYFPHRDYQLYSADGQRLQRVWNHQNHQDETPAQVTLPAGKYVVRADATFHGTVEVPVVIRPGQTTRVVLQPGWQPGHEVASSDLVQIPDGYPVGWRADLTAP